LIQQLTVVENIEVPLYYMGSLGKESRKRCHELAALVGLSDRLNHRPTQLSGGQQQRVAIARSLVNDPYFILADEPTGNLDTATTEEILRLFENLNNMGKTIIMVTHENDVAAHAKREIRLRDGVVQSDIQIGEKRVTHTQQPVMVAASA
jgi:putative ABC transport system ATP-binding protein